MREHWEGEKDQRKSGDNKDKEKNEARRTSYMDTYPEEEQ